VNSVWGLAAATFTASFVEFVEALTIVLAVGLTRGWRSALAGTAGAVASLVIFAAIVGYAVVRFLPEAWLKLIIGTLLLVFGLQWLRKAILRTAGIAAMHDEDAEFATQTAHGQRAGHGQWWGLDRFGTLTSFKAVFLEGAEVVVIVVTFGLTTHRVPVAALAAIAAGLVVVLLGLLVHRPLSAVPENVLKYGVGLVLATYGTFWAVSGLGVLAAGGEPLRWPGGDLALLALLAGWFGLSRLVIGALRAGPRHGTGPAQVAAAVDH
jgi:Ca2+/H+ antiporter, TMEM165/GDT1 family